MKNYLLSSLLGFIIVFGVTSALAQEADGVFIPLTPETLGQVLFVKLPPLHNPEVPRSGYEKITIRCAPDGFKYQLSSPVPAGWQTSFSSVTLSGQPLTPVVEEHPYFDKQLMCRSRLGDQFYFHRSPPQDMPECFTTDRSKRRHEFICRSAGAYVFWSGEDTVNPSHRFSVASHSKSRREASNLADFWWRAQTRTSQSLSGGDRGTALFAPLTGNATIKNCMNLIRRHNMREISGDRLQPGTKWCYKTGFRENYGWLEVKSRPGSAPSKLHFSHVTWARVQPYMSSLKPWCIEVFCPIADLSILSVET